MVTETLHPKLADILRRCAREVFEATVGSTPTSVEPCAVPTRGFDDEVVGVLGFTGSRRGALVVATGDRLACAMAARLQEPGTGGPGDAADDGFARVVARLGAGFRAAWTEGGHLLELAVPYVVRGGRVLVAAAGSAGLRSCVRVAIEDRHVDVGVQFEARS